MQRRYPVLQNRRHKLRLRKKRIALFVFFLLLMAVIGVAVNSVNFFNRITDSEEFAAALKEKAGEANRVNHLVLLLRQTNDEKELSALYFVSSHEESPYALFLPGNSGEAGEFFTNRYKTAGVEGVVSTFKGMTEEAVHYYTALDDTWFAVVGEMQGLSNPGPNVHIPPVPEEGEMPQLDSKRWEKEGLNFVTELAGRVTFWRWPGLIRESLPYVQTNLSFREITALISGFKEYSLPENRQFLMPPGEWIVPEEGGGLPVYLVDVPSLKLLLDVLREGSLLPPEEVDVEVLNGSGVHGLAGKAADFLESAGFNVVNVGNAETFDFERTQVISRIEEMTPAKEVAITLKGAELIKRVEEISAAMVTVIIGLDFDEHRVFND